MNSLHTFDLHNRLGSRRKVRSMKPARYSFMQHLFMLFTSCILATAEEQVHQGLLWGDYRRARVRPACRLPLEPPVHSVWWNPSAIDRARPQGGQSRLCWNRVRFKTNSEGSFTLWMPPVYCEELLEGIARNQLVNKMNCCCPNELQAGFRLRTFGKAYRLSKVH